MHVFSTAELKRTLALAHQVSLSGYLRASGDFALRPHREKVPQFRILAGIDVNEIVAGYHRIGFWIPSRLFVTFWQFLALTL